MITKATELWLIVPGFNGRYSGSDLGNVRNNETGNPVCQWDDVSRDGKPYAAVCLYYPDPSKSGRKRRAFRVHRLVVSVHRFNSEDLPDGVHVDHDDRDRLNNRIENLNVVGASEHIRMHRNEQEAGKVETTEAKLEECF